MAESLTDIAKKLGVPLDKYLAETPTVKPKVVKKPK